MSDDRLRELERRWRASRSEDDLAAWLRARGRTSGGDPTRLRWAAALGCEAAAAALGEAITPLPWPTASLDSLRDELRSGPLPENRVRGLHAHFSDWLPMREVPTLVERLVLAGARCLLGWWHGSARDDVWAPELLRAGGAWLLEPSEARREALIALRGLDPGREQLQSMGAYARNNNLADRVYWAYKEGYYEDVIAHSALATLELFPLLGEEHESEGMRRVLQRFPSQADYRIPDERVSRRHARLRFRDAGWWISDLSSNGTFVGEQPIEGEVRLLSYTPFRLGNTRLVLDREPD